MELINIDNIAHLLYDSFSKLYSTAFPIFEQRTETQQTRTFSHPKYHLSGYKEEDIFIGFISYWDFQEYIYIEHFAIDRQLRGSGYGSRILKDFISQKSKSYYWKSTRLPTTFPDPVYDFTGNADFTKIRIRTSTLPIERDTQDINSSY